MTITLGARVQLKYHAPIGEMQPIVRGIVQDVRTGESFTVRYDAWWPHGRAPARRQRGGKFTYPWSSAENFIPALRYAAGDTSKG